VYLDGTRHDWMDGALTCIVYVARIGKYHCICYIQL